VNYCVSVSRVRRSWPARQARGHWFESSIAHYNASFVGSANTRQNCVIFRLATCCGLRVSEAVGLPLANEVTGSKRPHVYVPAAIAKRNKARKVVLGISTHR